MHESIEDKSVNNAPVPRARRQSVALGVRPLSRIFNFASPSDIFDLAANSMTSARSTGPQPPPKRSWWRKTIAITPPIAAASKSITSPKTDDEDCLPSFGFRQQLGLHNDLPAGMEDRKEVFAVPLSDAVAASYLDPQLPLPAVVIRCIEYLDGVALNELGIYRVAGSTSLIQRLRQIFDCGCDINFFNAETHMDPHAASSLLKQFLREIPDHILGSEDQAFLDSFRADMAAERDPVPGLAALAVNLPVANYSLLSWVFSHLERVVYYESQNKMTVNNLALIFSPTLRIEIPLFSVLLTNSKAIFPTKTTLFTDVMAKNVEHRPSAPGAFSGANGAPHSNDAESSFVCASILSLNS